METQTRVARALLPAHPTIKLSSSLTLIPCSQRTAFLYGERLVDRLDFEELALKSLDPSLGPKFSDIVPRGQKSETAPTVRTASQPAPLLRARVPLLSMLFVRLVVRGGSYIIHSLVRNIRGPSSLLLLFCLPSA